MALHTLTEDGYLGWTCPKCSQDRREHISHEAIKAVLPFPEAPIHTRLVQTPACSCGMRVDLKVDFTPEELAAPNMIDAQGQPTPSHATAHRHMALARQMIASGKRPNIAPTD
jgi:hypothetical protein